MQGARGALRLRQRQRRRGSEWHCSHIWLLQTTGPAPCHHLHTNQLAVAALELAEQQASACSTLGRANPARSPSLAPAAAGAAVAEAASKPRARMHRRLADLLAMLRALARAWEGTTTGPERTANASGDGRPKASGTSFAWASFLPTLNCASEGFVTLSLATSAHRPATKMAGRWSATLLLLLLGCWVASSAARANKVPRAAGQHNGVGCARRRQRHAKRQVKSVKCCLTPGLPWP